MSKLLTDQELINAFSVKTGKRYIATFIPIGSQNTPDNWQEQYFYASSKPEAQLIAREYANRIIGKQLVYVYLSKNK